MKTKLGKTYSRFEVMCKDIYEKTYNNLLKNESFPDYYKKFLNNELTEKEIATIFGTMTTGAIYAWLKNFNEFIEARVIFDRLNLIETFFEVNIIPERYYAVFILTIILRNIESGILEENNKYEDCYNAVDTKDFLATDNLNNQRDGFSNIDYFEEQCLKNLEENYASLSGIKGLIGGTFASLEDYQKFCKAHQLIKEHFFDKSEDFTEEDIEIICNAFKDLRIGNHFVELIKQFLQEKIELVKSGKEITFENGEQYIFDFAEDLLVYADQCTNDAAHNIYLQDKENIDNSISRFYYAISLIGFLLDFEDAKEHKHLLDNFTYLEDCLLKSKLPIRKKYDVLFYIINSNIKAGLLDIDVNKEIEFTGLNYGQKANRAKMPKISQLSSPAFDEAWEKFESKLTKLSVEKVLLLQRNHQVIKEHYLDKKDCFTVEDVNYVIESLKELGLSDSILRDLGKFLRREVFKRNKLENANSKKELTPVTCLSREEIDKPRETISRKEYNILHREFVTYFNCEEKRPLSYLGLEDIIRCLYLLNKMGVSLEERNRFIKVVERFNKTSDINPILRYLDLRSKFAYFSIGNEEIARILGELDECFDMLDVNDSDYSFYKEFINNGIREALSLIPNNYEYEQSEVKKLELSKEE